MIDGLRAGRVNRGASGRMTGGILVRRCMLLLAIFITAVWVAPSTSIAQDVFTVSGVDVDVTGQTAASARAQALADGEQRAFDILLRRLTVKADHDRLPKPAPQALASMVQDLSVANEKTSAVRYLATVTYRFKASEIRQLLRDSFIDFAETRSKPVLVLPVYRAAGVTSLWDDPNPWRDAWEALGQQGNLVPMVFPEGDLSDIATIGAEQAVVGDRQRLAALSKRYETSDVIVALGELRSGPLGLPTIQVTVNRYGESVSEQAIITGIEANPDETLPDLLQRTAAAVADEIEDQWKSDNLLQFERNAVIAVVLPITGLPDWIDVRRRLSRIAVIERIDIVLLSRDEVRLNIQFLGEVEQLALALAQRDINLSEQDGSWVIKLGSRPPPPSTNHGDQG